MLRKSMQMELEWWKRDSLWNNCLFISRWVSAYERSEDNGGNMHLTFIMSWWLSLSEDGGGWHSWSPFDVDCRTHADVLLASVPGCILPSTLAPLSAPSSHSSFQPLIVFYLLCGWTVYLFVFYPCKNTGILCTGAKCPVCMGPFCLVNERVTRKDCRLCNIVYYL